MTSLITKSDAAIEAQDSSIVPVNLAICFKSSRKRAVHDLNFFLFVSDFVYFVFHSDTLELFSPSASPD